MYLYSSPFSYLWDDFYFITTFATTECKYLHLLSYIIHMYTMFIPSSQYVYSQSVCTHLFLSHNISVMTSTSSLHLQPQEVSIYLHFLPSDIAHMHTMFKFHRYNAYIHNLYVLIFLSIFISLERLLLHHYFCNHSM